ncbi:MAG: hypothetical protein Q8N55_00805, partial [bacterium]|nr:hypothetical protein [bacterium]
AQELINLVHDDEKEFKKELSSLDRRSLAPSKEKEAINLYCEYVLEKLGKDAVDTIRQAGLKVLLDPNGGTALKVLKQLALKFNLKAKFVNDEIGVFNRLIEPKVESLAYLDKFFEKDGFEFAAGFDCDADRVEFVSNGSLINGNYVLALACESVLQGTENQVVVTNDVTSYLVRDVIKKYQAVTKEVEVGETVVVSEMEKQKSIIGGEGSNGGVIIPPIKCRDGIMTFCLILKLITEKGQPLSNILKGYPRYYSSHNKVACQPENALSLKRKLESYYQSKGYVIKKTGDDTGGLKAECDQNSYIWFRLSKTEPGAFRIYVETDTSQAKADNLAKEAIQLFNTLNLTKLSSELNLVSSTQNIFRAYDVRGVYPGELNEEVVKRTAMAMAEQYPHCQKFVLASDPRKSSPALAKAIVEGFTSMGKDVIDLGIAPDPLFYFAILHYGYDGGIALSGSHNPPQYNGLTLNARNESSGEQHDVILADLVKIKQRVFDNKPFKMAKKKGKVVVVDLKEKYVNYVSSKIKLKKSLKIIIDVGNGACGLIPEMVFKKFGCEVKTLFAEPDGTFPNHMPDPYKEENLKDLKKAVLKEGADVGFAFDTDGDRVAPIDNKGNVISGDNCMLILARQALSKKIGPVVHCTRISQAFLDEMKEKNIKTHYSVCHHSAVQQNIVENKAVFGGEITYHYLFPLDYYLCDEAFLTAFKIAEIVSEKDDFSQYIDSLPKYFPSIEVFVETPDEIKEKLIKGLQVYLKENNYNFVSVDGARILFENGWALARFSNTGPQIKIRFEGKTKADLIEIEKKCLPIFEQVGIPLNKEHYQQLGL